MALDLNHEIKELQHRVHRCGVLATDLREIVPQSIGRHYVNKAAKTLAEVWDFLNNAINAVPEGTEYDSFVSEPTTKKKPKK